MELPGRTPAPSARGDLCSLLTLNADTVSSPLALGRRLLALDEDELARLLVDSTPEQLEDVEAAFAAVEAQARADRWLDDPLAWIEDCVDLQGTQLHPYQADALRDLADHSRLAVRSPHGVGKTAMAALAILWFATSRDAAGIEWKVPTTASVGRQLKHYLWPEVHVWAQRIRWDALGRKPFTGNELQLMMLRLEHGQSWAMASHDPATLEGAHARHLLYVFDEAKAIPDPVWDAAEGAFSGAGADTRSRAWALAISTPGEPVGRFYQISRRDRRFAHWRARHITLAEAVAAGQISREWAETMAVQWSRGSAIFANRVLGEFASSPAESVIPLPWVEAANERWHDQRTRPEIAAALPTHAGLDVARFGNDENVLVRLADDFCGWPYRPPQGDSIAVARNVLPLVGTGPLGPLVMVDADGVGAGVYDQLATEPNLKPRLRAFVAGSGTNWRDASGLLTFANLRSAAWWHLRDLLNPDNCAAPGTGAALALPPDELLTGDLTAPKWRQQANDRIIVEGKDEIRKRIGRSTDTGDALIMALWGRIEGAMAVVRVADHRGPPSITGDLLTASF